MVSSLLRERGERERRRRRRRRESQEIDGLWQGGLLDLLARFLTQEKMTGRVVDGDIFYDY